MPRAIADENLEPVVVRLLDESRARFDEEDLEGALAAAEQACAKAGRSISAWLLRAATLAELGRTEEAYDGFEKALALDRKAPDTLLAFADFCVTHSGDDRDTLELGLELAERGGKLARGSGDRELEGEFALLAGMVLNQLGDPGAALDRLDTALALLGADPDVRLEHAIAHFEISRFDEAKAEFESLVRDDPDEPWPHHYLGLLAERRGDAKQANDHFARARTLAPDEFPPPVSLAPAEFDAAVEEALAELPEKVRRYLENVAIAVEDFPPLDDLVANAPPLSPQILGIFRGSPLGEKASSDPWAHFPSSIVLYQRNLERFARDRDHLIEEIGITLIHEVGHFLGLDEDDLRDRGLD